MKWFAIAKWGGGVLGGLALAWIFYAGLIRPTTKPNPTTTNYAGEIVNYSIYPRVSFGCANFRILRRESEPTEITKDIIKVR